MYASTCSEAWTLLPIPHTHPPGLPVQRATSHASSWAKSWHQWALFNVAVMQHYVSALDPDAAILHVAPAVHGFFRSVALGQAAGDRTGNLQVWMCVRCVGERGASVRGMDERGV
eukprot:354599-Chlamydomonas_euryale.AAC.2